MLSNRISDFANTISFTLTDDSAFGFIDNFIFSVYESGVKKTFFVYFSLDDMSAERDEPVSIMTISSSLQSVFGKYGITDYSIKEDGLEVNCTLSFKEFYSLMKETAKKLSQFKAIKGEVCCSCGEAVSKDSCFRISKNFKNRLLCTSCADEISNETTDDENSEAAESNEGSSFKGILGSILFGIGISICLILLYSFVVPLPNAESSFKPGYYVNWINAFMPIAAIFGYKIFSKKAITNKLILVTGGISIFLSLISQYISSMILFARESIFTFEEITSERIFKMIPSLLKIPFTDSYVGPDFKIYVLMDAIFVVVALLVISFFSAPKAEAETIIEEL